MKPLLLEIPLQGPDVRSLLLILCRIGGLHRCNAIVASIRD